jgi:superfamily II DNA/RNA helicase
MREVDVRNAIIFCNRKKDVGIIYRSLQRHGFNVGALHGDMDQHQRTATLDAFRNGTIAFLAASDVAARGLDIPDVSHIFNYDVPIHPEDYIHRIGRTGRAGREGFAAMLVTPKDHKALKAIERMLKQEIPWIDGAASEPAPRDATESRANGNGNGNSNGKHRRGNRSRRGKGPSAPGAQASRAPHQPQPQSQPQREPVPSVQRNAPPQNGSGEKRREEHRKDARHEPRKPHQPQQHHGERKGGHVVHGASPERPQGNATQQSRSKQQGMGDHVPAFMMRPVRVT